MVNLALEDRIELRRETVATADRYYQKKAAPESILNLIKIAYEIPADTKLGLTVVSEIACADDPYTLAMFTLDCVRYNNDPLYGIAPEHYFEEMVNCYKVMTEKSPEELVGMSEHDLIKKMKSLFAEGSLCGALKKAVKEGPEWTVLSLGVVSLSQISQDLLALVYRLYPLTAEEDIVKALFEHYRHRLVGHRKWVNIIPYLTPPLPFVERWVAVNRLKLPMVAKALSVKTGVTISVEEDYIIVGDKTYKLEKDLVLVIGGNQVVVVKKSELYHQLPLYEGGVAALEDK